MPEEKKEQKLLVDTLKPMHEAETVTVSREMMAQVNPFNLMAEMLKEEGVEQTFCVTHGATWAIEIATQRAGIPRVHMRHEQATTFAADAWGRMTRKPGVAIVGPGTALCNATSGVTQGYAAGAPMVVIVCDSLGGDDRFSPMGISSTENQYQGITKWARRVNTPGAFLWQLKRAFRSAVTHPTGPVALAPAADPLGGPLRMTKMQAYQLYTPGYWAPDALPRTPADPALVEKALRWLLEAEKPAMIVGHALHQDDAQEELREFVHLLGIPCHARRSARGAISDYDPLNPGGRARGVVLRGSDRTLVMGLRIGFLEGEGKPPFWGANTRYIQAQTCPEMVDLVLATEHQLIGNIKTMLRQFIDCAKDLGIKGPPAKWEKWRQFVADTKQDYERRTLERTERMRGKMPLHPDLVGRLATEFFHDEYQDDYIPVIDGWVASSFFSDWSKIINAGTVLDSAEPIGMGHAFGMAVAAGLATKREKPIFAVIGDGAIGAGGMDIETASRWNIPAIFFHENNNTMISGRWNLFLSEVCNPTGNHLLDSWEVLPDTRYDRMFAEFGCHPEFVENDAQLKPALKRACDFAMREKKPAFVEVFIDPDVMHEGLPRAIPMFSHWVKWDELAKESQQTILEYDLLPRAMLPMVDPTWRDAILAYEKQKKG